MGMFKQKTTWTGVGALVAGVGGFLTGTMDAGTAIQTVLAGFMAIFIRQAVANK